MAMPFGPHFDHVERQRRILEQILPKDPLAGYLRTVEQAMLVDPLARQNAVLAKITGADRIAQLQRSLIPVVPDPFAEQRRVFEQPAKQRSDAYDQVIARLTGLPDPFAAQRRTIEKLLSADPFRQYEQVVKSFNALLGGVMPPVPVPDFEPEPAKGFELRLPSRTMVIHLLAIASICAWMIIGGVSAERLMALMFDALLLAEHLSGSE